MPVETHHITSIQLRDAARGERVSVSFEIDGKPATEAKVRALVARKRAAPDSLSLTAESKVVKG